MKLSTRHLLQIGLTTNIFEWYEFIVFAYLAEVIGPVFFSTKMPDMALISTFAVIATSYFARPVGSIFFGYIGDKNSIERVIKFTAILMAIPTIIIGLLPTYKQIGILSPVCLVILRLIQGFAAGGEYPGSASYIYNKSVLHSKNSVILCCLPIIGSMSGVLLASFVINILYKVFSVTTIIEWAWRIPFLLSIPLVIYIIIIRNSIPQTQKSTHIDSKKQILYENYFLKFITAFIIAGFLEISFYILLVWLPSYLKINLNISHQIIHVANLFALASALISTLLFSYLAKYINYKILLRCGILMVMASVYLMHVFISSSLIAVILVQIILGISIGCIQGVFFFSIGKLFPDHIRSRGVAISYTCAASFLGGTAPFLCSYVIKQTHFVNFPEIYILTFGMLAFIFSWLL